MNLGQLLLVVLALSLLGTAALMINSTVLRSSQTNMDSEARVNAISVGQAMIDEINSKAFDSCTVTDTIFNPGVLTPVNKLGPDRTTEKTVVLPDKEPYQSQTRFNDVDDYNRYTRVDSSFHLGPFAVRDSVYYVQDGNLDAYSSTPTFYKKIIVVVKHPNLVDSVVIKSLAVYRQYY